MNEPTDETDFESLGHEYISAQSVLDGRPDDVLARARLAAATLNDEERTRAEDAFTRGANRQARFRHEATFAPPFPRRR